MNGPTSSENYSRTILSDVFEIDGTIDTLAQATPETVTGEVQVVIGQENILRIRMNLTIEDGDENTNPDNIEYIILRREDGGESQEITDPGRDTPYSTSIELNYQGDEDFASTWVFEITVTCNAGDDTWIGPFIWHGVTDHGIVYHIDGNYDYIVIE